MFVFLLFDGFFAIQIHSKMIYQFFLMTEEYTGQIPRIIMILVSNIERIANYYRFNMRKKYRFN